jgi:type II secretory pathway component GspD/PulD (secretin)
MHEGTDRIGLSWVICLTAAVAASFFSASLPSTAWSLTVVVQEDQPQSVGGTPARSRRGGARGANPGEPQPTPPPQGEAAKPNQPPGTEKKEGQPAAGEKKEEKPADVQRPEAPPREADPKELDVLVNEQGLVPPFNFQGQPWPAVLQWYAKLGNYSLDWQELPSGYINVFTQRPYSLEDVRSLLNRYLLARGFTMLLRDRVVSIFKMENLDPSLVEQVSEIELFSRKPYDIAKVAFAMPKNMDIAKAKDDLKQVLNPKARVMPFVSTRQVLVIDAVANLQTLSQMINEERLKEEGKSPLREFVLKYRRAEEVIDILYVTLGLDPKSKPSQMELQLQQQKMQIMQQMAQRGTDVASMLKKDGPPVYLSYNRQKNSVIANAPEEQMDLIDKTLKMLDVPIGGVAPAKDATANTEVDRTIKTTTFKLKTLNPQSFATTIEEIGGLDPFTVVKADSTARSIFVQGVTADHERIKDLIEQLDGEERFFKMIQLRHYPAGEAATTIRELIAGKREVKDENSQDVYYRALASMYSSSSRSGGTPKEDPHEGFYVAADEINRRLLVKANKLELELIMSLLRELGEVPTERKNGVAMRVMDPPGGDILEKIRKAWSETEDNPLVIDAPAKATAKNDDESEADAEKKKPQATTPAKDRGVQSEKPVDTAAVLARFTLASSDETASASAAAPADNTAGAAPTKTQADQPQAGDASKPAADSTANQPQTTSNQPNGQPPVSVTVTEDGRIVIRSSDPDAVERMEALISELSPAPKRVKVFPVTHQYASDVCYNLKEIFEEELKEEAQTIRDWYGNSQKTSGRESGTGLGKRPKMIIDYDIRTNSVFVSNATAAQLQEIGELIAEFDKPPAEGKVKGRRNATVKINYSKASIIAAALKEVYIDLLTTRDKEFDAGDGKRQNSGSGYKLLTDIKFGEKTGNGADKPTRIGLNFNGELSIGADDVSNNILISCQEELFDGVVDQIRRLDEESAPKMSIVVQPLNGTYKAADLQKTMESAVGKSWLGGRPEDQIAARGGPSGQPNGNPGQNNPPRGNRGGGAARQR